MGAGKASVLMNYYSMTADAVDYGQWKQGRRVEAYSFGFLSLSSKLGLALGGGLMGLALDWAGFVSNVAQDADTLARLRIAIFLVPEIGRASCRERVCQDGENSGVADNFKKKRDKKN